MKQKYFDYLDDNKTVKQAIIKAIFRGNMEELNQRNECYIRYWLAKKQVEEIPIYTIILLDLCIGG